MMLEHDLSVLEDFIAAYGLWMSDLYTPRNTKDCTPSLRGYFLCCPEHRRLYAELKMLENWGYYFYNTYDIASRYAEEDATIGRPPSPLSKVWWARLADVSGAIIPFLEDL